MVALVKGMNEERPESLRDLAKGIGIRAGALSVAAVIVGAWVFGLAAKAASGVVKVLAALFVLTAGAGVATWKVKKAQRHFAQRRAAMPTL
jgi:hypothetical protein